MSALGKPARWTVHDRESFVRFRARAQDSSHRASFRTSAPVRSCPPESHELVDLVVAIAVFGLLALSSRTIGQVFGRVHLPQITGFLFTGILAGPYVLGVVTETAVNEIIFLDEVALGFIAFAAGGELLLKELRSRLRTIRCVTVSLVSFTFVITACTVYAMSDRIPFMADADSRQRLAIAILAGAILVARSPSSAIAVVNELRARGPFTRMALGVTIVMDVVVILLFAVSTAIADSLQTSEGFSGTMLLFVLLGVSGSLLLGSLVGKFLLPILLRLRIPQDVKTIILLSLGFGVFQLSAWLKHATHDLFPHEVFLEPLLVCMSTSFVLTNYTTHRASLQQLLDSAGPFIYVVFFTLAGASLRIDVLSETWGIALILFGVRLVAIFFGALTGGAVAGDPMRFNRVAWMSFITQAGIGLGLAKEVAVEFPEWGREFSTMIIAVIVMNQIVGPPLFKWVLHIVGEAHVGAGRQDLKGSPLAVVMGWDAQSTALARQLDQHGWRVKIASRKATESSVIPGGTAEVVPIEEISLQELTRIGAAEATAIVAMIEANENLKVCEFAFEHFGTQNIVAKVLDRDLVERFHEMNVRVVNPETSMVGLLDHFVRSPGATSLLLGLDEAQDVEDITVRNPDLNGVALRDLRLPLDTLVLSVSRKGAALLSHGYTTLHVGDIVTVVGSPKSLGEIALKLAADD